MAAQFIQNKIKRDKIMVTIRIWHTAHAPSDILSTIRTIDNAPQPLQRAECSDTFSFISTRS